MSRLYTKKSIVFYQNNENRMHFENDRQPFGVFDTLLAMYIRKSLSTSTLFSS